MPKTKHSPVKLLSDLGIDVMNLSSQEDYKSALVEGLAKLQYTGETSSERFKILKDEVLRVKREKLKAEDPTYTTKEERPPIVKKTKITGADIKRTGAVGSAEKVTADTTGISAIQKWKPSAGGEDLAKADDVTPEDQSQPSGLIGALKTIDSSVNGIIETLKSSNKADAKAQSDVRKAAEKEKRKKAEGKLEAITGPIGKAAEKVLAPVKSIFEKIFGFLMTIFAGNIAMRLFDWFSDPSNGKKIGAIFKFLKDWWPVLLASLMWFFPVLLGPGGFILGVVALLAWGIPKILDAIKWVKGLFGIGVQKEITALGKDSKKEAEDISKNIDEDLTKDTDKILKDQDEPVPENTGDSKETPKELANVSQDSPPKGDLPPGPPPEGMNRGGIVPGSGPNRDTVPAMLTPGEFVMSRDAVQQYGSNTLAGMNAAAGGTNRPRMGRYRGGGEVGGSRIHYSGGGIVNTNRFGGDSLTFPRIPVQYFKGGGEVKKPQGMMRWLAGAADVATGGVFDFDKRGSMMDGAKRIGKQKLDSSINPPSTPTTEVIVDQGVASQVQAAGNSMPDMDLPYFSAGAMISQSKIRTLGIVV